MIVKEVTSTSDSGLEHVLLLGVELEHTSAANAQIRYDSASGGVITRLQVTAEQLADRNWAPGGDDIWTCDKIHVTLSAGSVRLYIKG